MSRTKIKGAALSPDQMTPRQFMKYVEAIEGTLGLHRGRLKISNAGFDALWKSYETLLLSYYPHENHRLVYKKVRERFLEESFGQTDYLSSYARRRAKAVLGEDWETVRKIPVGWISKLEINAAAIAVPVGGSLIVVNLGLFLEVTWIMYTILHLLHAIASGEGSLTSPEDYAKQILQIIGAPYGIEFHTRTSIPDPPRLHLFRMSVECGGLQLLFVLLHEYAHVLLGHLSENNLSKPHPWDDPARKISYYKEEMTEEYEADQLATKWYENLPRRASPEKDPLPSIALVSLFEICRVQDLVSISAVIRPDTHPPPKERLEKILNMAFLGEGMHRTRREQISALFSRLRQFYERGQFLDT